MSPDKLTTLMKLGSGVAKVLDMKDRFAKSIDLNPLFTLF